LFYTRDKNYLTFKFGALLIVEREEIMTKEGHPNVALQRNNENEDDDDINEESWAHSFYEGRFIMGELEKALNLTTRIFMIREVIEAFVILLRPHIYSFLLQRKDMSEELYNTSILEVMRCVKHLDVYKAVRNSFFAPLVKNTNSEFNFTLDEGFNIDRKIAF